MIVSNSSYKSNMEMETLFWNDTKGALTQNVGIESREYSDNDVSIHVASIEFLNDNSTYNSYHPNFSLDTSPNPRGRLQKRPEKIVALILGVCGILANLVFFTSKLPHKVVTFCIHKSTEYSDKKVVFP